MDERDPIGYFASAALGALGAGALLVMGWHLTDNLLRRMRPKAPASYRP